MVVEFLQVLDLRKRNTNSDKPYYFSQISINPQYVVYTEEDTQMRQALQEGLFVGVDLNKNHQFTKVTIQEGQHISRISVVGSKSEVDKKLNSGAKILLKG